DPARAEQILHHIAATEDAIAQAKEEAAKREGVAGSLSQTTVVTQELTLAQQRLAYFQSAYGIALPEQSAAGSGRSDASSPTVDDRSTPSPGDGASDAGEIGAVIGKVNGNPAEALPPLQEVAVPQLPPVTYTRRDYSRIQLLLD